MTDINDDDLKSLAAKLDGLDLNAAERAALDGVLDRAEAFEPDVEGFAFDAAQYTGQIRSGADLSGTALKLGGGLGFVLRPTIGYGSGDFRPPPP